MKIEKLQKKIKKSQFTTFDSQKLGISNQLLAQYLKKGFIERVSHGVYCFPDRVDLDFNQLLKERLEIFPHAIVGHKTALVLYNLIDETPSEFDLIVPKSNVPKREVEDVRLHICKDDLYKRDITTINGIAVTSIERIVIDLLRVDEPLSFLLSLFREARMKSIPISLSKIKRLSVPFRVKKKVLILLDALL